MADLQQDVVDEMAKHITPLAINLARGVKDQLSQEQKLALEEMLIPLEDWKYDFSEESVSASIYAYW